ncbi:hypothetical protein PPS11_32770 [Pseudomonas putida S11]|nr:hypothetical protein PPS11_32770 [Pseudomonas putida S11]
MILGLLGGGHCLGMCGGLMGALTLAIPPEQRGRRMRLLLAYNLGRILSYACAGLLLGLAGWAVASSPAALALRVVAALLLIAMGLVPGRLVERADPHRGAGPGTVAAYSASGVALAAGVQRASGVVAGGAIGGGYHAALYTAPCCGRPVRAMPGTARR